jgi:hypothetical protein
MIMQVNSAFLKTSSAGHETSFSRPGTMADGQQQCSSFYIRDIPTAKLKSPVEAGMIRTTTDFVVLDRARHRGKSENAPSLHSVRSTTLKQIAASRRSQIPNVVGLRSRSH